jgi:hypothetical protein
MLKQNFTLIGILGGLLAFASGCPAENSEAPQDDDDQSQDSDSSASTTGGNAPMTTANPSTTSGATTSDDGSSEGSTTEDPVCPNPQCATDEECGPGKVCLDQCLCVTSNDSESDTDDPTGGGSDTDATECPAGQECIPTTMGNICGFTACVLECGGEITCPDGMECQGMMGQQSCQYPTSFAGTPDETYPFPSGVSCPEDTVPVSFTMGFIYCAPTCSPAAPTCPAPGTGTATGECLILISGTPQEC